MRLLLLLGILLWTAARTVAAEPAVVAASTYPLQLFARMVTDRPVALLLDASTGCPHDHVLTLAERTRTAQATIVITHGLHLDDALLALLRPDQTVICATAGITDGVLPSTDHGPNPHLFASPRRAAAYVLTIGEGLARAFPDDAPAIRARSAEAAQRFHTLADDLFAAMHDLPRRHVVLQHDGLAYLCHDVGLTVEGVIEEEPGEPPRAAALAALVRRTRATRAVVLADPQYPDTVAVTVAKDAGAPLVRWDSLASGPAEAPVDAYERILRRQSELLADALRQP